jgi:hypothetical protein
VQGMATTGEDKTSLDTLMIDPSGFLLKKGLASVALQAHMHHSGVPHFSCHMKAHPFTTAHVCCLLCWSSHANGNSCHGSMQV